MTRPVDPLSARLRDLRLEKGWTLAEVGARCGLTLQQVGAYEKGVCVPQLHNLRRWAAVFDLRVSLSHETR